MLRYQTPKMPVYAHDLDIEMQLAVPRRFLYPVHLFGSECGQIYNMYISHRSDASNIRLNNRVASQKLGSLWQPPLYGQNGKFYIVNHQDPHYPSN